MTTKAKTNALEALRALIAQRQQYEQWISVLETKREGTLPHVFERVSSDYNGRLQRVVSDIRGHAEELQLSISTLSSRLVEVAREEDTKREALQEAELRAAVGEYEPQHWDELRNEHERALEKITADRVGLDSQLGELRSIQTLSEVGSVGDVGAVVRSDAAVEPDTVVGDAAPASAETPSQASDSTPPESVQNEPVLASSSETPSFAKGGDGVVATADTAGERGDTIPAESNVSAVDASAPTMERGMGTGPYRTPDASSLARPRMGKTPPFGSVVARARSTEPRLDQAKTLKCPECGVPNYPTEWYCEKCGGELATM